MDLAECLGAPFLLVCEAAGRKIWKVPGTDAASSGRLEGGGAVMKQHGPSTVQSRQPRVRAGCTLRLGARCPALRVIRFLSARVITSKSCVLRLLGVGRPSVCSAADTKSSLSCVRSVRNCVTVPPVLYQRGAPSPSALRAFGLSPDTNKHVCVCWLDSRI